MSADEHKNCPYCGGEIKLLAVKCKHCYKMIEESSADEAKHIPQDKASSYSAPELLLLSKFKKGDAPERYYNDENWKAALNKNPKVVIDKLIKEGMLEKAGLAEKANNAFKLSELKALLKKRGLKTTGKKDELIDRLVKECPAELSESVGDLELYRCSNIGVELAEEYLAIERKKKLDTEQKVLNLLKQKNYKKAADLVASYESDQVFPRGMGIDWNNYDSETTANSIRDIFENTPPILKNISESNLTAIRLGAAMMYLWGVNDCKQWLPQDIEINSRLDCNTACRMFVFHARHKSNVQKYKDAIKAGVSIKNFQVLATTDSCPECQKIAGKKYKLDEIPELPYENCTNAKGCRCIMVSGDM